MRRDAVGLELDEKDMQVVASEGPLERFGGALIAVLESNRTAFEGFEIGEIAWREELTLNNGEVDLDLVEPTRMDRRVDQDDVWPLGSQSSSGTLAAVGGTVVCDEEHAMCGTIWFLARRQGRPALRQARIGARR